MKKNTKSPHVPMSVGQSLLLINELASTHTAAYKWPHWYTR